MSILITLRVAHAVPAEAEAKLLEVTAIVAQPVRMLRAPL
jgi:hypothetical protein